MLYWLENGAQPSDTVRSLISKRGLMLHHHLKKKGKSPEQIAEAVDEHIQRLEEKGEDIKMTAEMRRAQAIEEERERAAELEEQRRKEEEERRKAEEEAKAKAEAEAAEEAAAEEADAAEADAETADAEAADAAEAADEDAADESDDTPKSDA